MLFRSRIVPDPDSKTPLLPDFFYAVIDEFFDQDFLKSLYEELAPPANVKVPVEAQKTFAAKKFRLGELPDRWAEFVAYFGTTGESMSGFLRTVPAVRTERSTLHLRVPNDFTRDWILAAENAAMLRNAIAHHVAVPVDFRVDADVGAEKAGTGSEEGTPEVAGSRPDSATYSATPDVDVHGKLLRRMKDLGGKGV